MRRRGWDRPDILIVSGDAYVDHPAFGSALLARVLESLGYRVAIAAQPRWDSIDDLLQFGRPRLCAGVTAGALDSMLAHYTAFRKKRHDDAYTPGGRSGARPNRACLVYAGLVRQAFPGLPVVLGGLEASMRRATHYDFWSDGFRRSMLLDAKADLLVTGMGERAMAEIARRLAGADTGLDPAATRRLLRGIPGTAYALGGKEGTATPHAESLPSHKAIAEDPSRLVAATLQLERQAHSGDTVLLQSAGDRTVVLMPPAEPLSTTELDALYALPFTRRAHPDYREPVPAIETVRFSLTSHRGCGGACTFCSLAMHQGRRIVSRSVESLTRETRTLTEHSDWTGSITDVGGPTANLWGAVCASDPAACRRKSCLFPEICRSLDLSQSAIIDMLDAVSAVPGVRHVRVASGVRHDLALRDPGYLRELVARFVGGQMKVAPEHSSDTVLRLMRKPPFKVFERFLEAFRTLSKRAGKEQYLVPYLISGFPGCTDADMLELRRSLDRYGWRPQQVQCFIPTPGTLASAMFAAGIDAEGHPIPVARTDAERLRQHGILMGSIRQGDGVEPRTSDYRRRRAESRHRSQT